MFKLRFRLQLTISEQNQRGINMVDLMMWLVIAALLLAAALQGIGFYQRAAWTNALMNDVGNTRTFIEGYKATNAIYPTQADLNAAITSGDLTLTKGNSIAGFSMSPADDWAVRICSLDLNKATGNAAGSAIRINRIDPKAYDKAMCN